MSKYRTVDGDRIDLICWAHYGSLDGRIVEQVLDANKGLSMNETLISGQEIILPEIEVIPTEQSLW